MMVEISCICAGKNSFPTSIWRHLSSPWFVEPYTQVSKRLPNIRSPIALPNLSSPEDLTFPSPSPWALQRQRWGAGGSAGAHQGLGNPANDARASGQCHSNVVVPPEDLSQLQCSSGSWIPLDIRPHAGEAEEGEKNGSQEGLNVFPQLGKMSDVYLL